MDQKLAARLKSMDRERQTARWTDQRQYLTLGTHNNVFKGNTCGFKVK